MSAVQSQIKSIDQVLPEMTKFLSGILQQEPEEIDQIAQIYQQFMKTSGLWDLLTTSLSEPHTTSSSKTPRTKVTTSTTSSSGDGVEKKARKERVAKDIEKLTPYDCYNKLVGIDWKSKTDDEKKAYIDPSRLDKNGKPISAFINYKGLWKTYSDEQKEQYKTRFYDLSEDERTQLMTKK